MKRIMLICLIACLALPALADTAQPKPVSVRRAVLYSALLPGAGELYAHSYNKGAFFLGTELAILFTWWRLTEEREWKIDSYKQYAAQYAGVPITGDDEVYRRLQNYYGSEDYNDGVTQDARNYFLIYLNDPEAYNEYISANIYTGEDTWQWQTQANWRQYQRLRNEKQDLEIYAKFALGAALVNRVISLIDAARTARNYNKGLLNGSLSVVPNWEHQGFMVNYAYRF